MIDPAMLREAVSYAITSRRSVRGFLPDPVAPEVIVSLLTIPARAPSGSNIQPWKMHVLTGPALADEKAGPFRTAGDHRVLLGCSA